MKFKITQIYQHLKVNFKIMHCKVNVLKDI